MKKRILPVLIILLALAGGAAAVLFTRAVLSGDWPAARTVRADALLLVELDDEWASRLAGRSTIQDMKDQIDETVTRVQALGGNAVALTGRVPSGAALFRDKTGTLTTVGAVTQSDRFFARFDAVNYLVRRAAAAGVEV